jgi:hypothetical protein
MIIAAYLLSFLCLFLNASLFVHLKPPYNFILAFSIQIVAVDLPPFLVILGLNDIANPAELHCFWLKNYHIVW